MKICTLSFHSCPYDRLGGDGSGGMSVYLKELSEVLCRQHGMEIDIFTRIKNPGVKGVVDINPSLRIIHLKGGPEIFLDRFQLFRYLPEFMKKLQDHIHGEKREYDLVYSHYWLSGLAGEWVAQNMGIPLVHTYHTVAILKEEALGIPEAQERLMAEGHLASRADRIISSSRQEKDQLTELFRLPANKISVVYPGFSRKILQPVSGSHALKKYTNDEKDLVLLYVGRIEPVKGLLNVVKAFQYLRSHRANLYKRLRFIIIGGGDRDDVVSKNQEALAVQKFAEENGMADKVEFLGSKKQDLLKDYYSAADALVVPSLYESFGLVVVESLACGTPVLVSSIGEMKSFVKEGKNGFLFSPDDPRSLADCLAAFSRGKDSLWPPQKISRDVGRTVSWEKTAGGVHKVFQSLVEKGRKSTTRSQPGENPQPV